MSMFIQCEYKIKAVLLLAILAGADVHSTRQNAVLQTRLNSRARYLARSTDLVPHESLKENEPVAFLTNQHLKADPHIRKLTKKNQYLTDLIVEKLRDRAWERSHAHRSFDLEHAVLGKSKLAEQDNDPTRQGGRMPFAKTIVGVSEPKAPDTSERVTQIRSVLAVMGGVLFMLCAGSSYCIGNLVLYMPERLKYWSGVPERAGVLPDALVILPTCIVSEMVSMPFGSLMDRHLGTKLTMILASIMMGGGVFIASYQTSLLPFIIFYAVTFGVGKGLGYQMPLLTGGRWFPNKRGSVSGIIVSAAGASAFVWNLMDLQIINPTSLNADAWGNFPRVVYERWPFLLRIHGCLLLLIGLTSALLQNSPASHKGTYPDWIQWFQGERGKLVTFEDGKLKQPTKVTAPSDRPVWRDICSVDFVLRLFMIFTSAMAGLCLAGNFKAFGVQQPALNNDAFLTLVGSLSSLLGNAGGRIFWGSMLDHFGFRGPFIVQTLIQALIMINFKALSANRHTFAASTILVLFCLGGQFSMFPAENQQKFGANAAAVYGFLFAGFGSASFLGPVLSKILLKHGGFDLLFSVLGYISLISTILTTQVPPSPLNVGTLWNTTLSYISARSQPKKETRR